MASTALPDDFRNTLDSIVEFGILDEGAEGIESRLADAMRGAAAASGEKPNDAGWTDWVLTSIEATKDAIHAELCASDGSGAKKEYNELLGLGLTSKGVTAISAAIIHVVNPTFAVSSVLIFLSTWLLKVGLNRWCALPRTR